MSKEANLKVQSMAGPIAQSRDWDRLGEIFAEDFVDHDPAAGQPAGVEGIKKYWREFTEAFPDFEIVPDAVSADDDFVTIVGRVSGTHTGEYKGHAPTGKRFSVRTIQTTKFDGGLVRDRWGSTDLLGLTQQLGIE